MINSILTNDCAFESQKESILNYLQSGKSLSPLEALNMFNCLRLGARISDLRKEGYKIQTTYNKKGKRYAKYILIH